MPLISFNTNLKDSELPDSFEIWLCETVGEILKKPMERISAQVNTGLRMCRKGESSRPMCLVRIHSIGVFDKERNPTYTAKLSTAINEKWNIPRDSYKKILEDFNCQQLAVSDCINRQYLLQEALLQDNTVKCCKDTADSASC